MGERESRPRRGPAVRSQIALMLCVLLLTSLAYAAPLTFHYLFDDTDVPCDGIWHIAMSAPVNSYVVKAFIEVSTDSPHYHAAINGEDGAILAEVHDSGPLYGERTFTPDSVYTRTAVIGGVCYPPGTILRFYGNAFTRSQP